MLKQPSATESKLIIVGDYLLDPCDGLLTGPSGAHHLCPRIIDLLCHFIERAGETVDREELMKELGVEEQTAPRLLNQYVARLRHYFEDSARTGNYIETVPNLGYRLVAPIYGTTPRSEGIRLARVAHPPGRSSRIGGLIKEFRDRKVCRAMLVYAIVVWLVFQVSEIVVPALSLPFWVNSLVVLLGILGFPIAAVLAWIFDWTPNGLVRQSYPAPDGAGGAPRRATELVFDVLLVAAALLLGAALLTSGLEYGSISSANAGTTSELSSAVGHLADAPR